MKLRLELVLLVQLLLLNLFASFSFVFFAYLFSPPFSLLSLPPRSLALWQCKFVGLFSQFATGAIKQKDLKDFSVSVAVCVSVSVKYFVASIWYCADSLAMSTRCYCCCCYCCWRCHLVDLLLILLCSRCA